MEDAAPDFLAGGGEMGALMRAHDWAATPLGSPDQWSQSLRTVIRLMLNTQHPIYVFWGPEGFCFYNDAYSLSIGPERHPGSLGQPAQAVWEEIWPVIGPQIEQVMTGGGATWHENQLLPITRNGVVDDVYWTYSYGPIDEETASGGIGGVLVICTETTATVAASQRLLDSEERLQQALSAGRGIGTWDWDVVTDQVYADARFAKMYGADPERARIGAPLAEFFTGIHPDDAPRVQADIAATLATGGLFSSEYRLVQPDGDDRWVLAEGSATLDETGAPVRMAGVTFDITERRMIRQALEDSEARYRTLFGTARAREAELQRLADNIPLLVSFIDPDHRYALSNRTYRDWFGEAAETMVGRPMRDVLGEEAYAAALPRVAAVLAGEPVSYEDYLTYREGGGRHVRADYVPRRDETGAIDGFYAIVQDISAQRRAELRRNVLLELNDAIRDLTDPAEIAHASSSILAEALNVSRVGYGVMDTAAETVTIERDYNAPGVQSIAGVIHFRDFGNYIEELSRGETVIFADAAKDPRVEDGGVALAGISATSLINMPLIERGKVVALLFVNNATPREWSDEDVALVREVAERVRTASERARLNTSLQDSERRLRFLDALAQATQPLTDADAVLAATTRMTAEHMGADICAYADMDEDQDGFTIRGDWAAPGSASIVGHYSLADFGGLAVRELGAGRPLIINDMSEIAPQDAATFHAIGIAATICMPLVKEGRLTALMAVHSATPHLWTPYEMAAIREVTERSWAHIERVRSEAERRDSEHQFRAFAQAVPNHIWASRPDGWLYWFNDQVYAYTGRADGELDGDATWAAVVHPDDLNATGEAWAHALATGELYQAEFRIRRYDGEWRWFKVRAEPTLDARGEITGWVGSNTDFDDQKASASALEQMNVSLEQRVVERTAELARTHEALRQSQKMEAVGQLTGGIAHDFNNLLAGISGSLELLSKRLSEGRLNGMERYIDAAQGSAQRAASLTQRLLAFSRRQTLDPKPTEVNRLINGMEDLIRRSVGPDVEVEVVGAGGLWNTRIDQSQLENALLNLCINARDAMAPAGGRLTIETSNKWLDDRAAKARDLPPGQYVSLCVTDTGTGMPPEVQAQAFDPFFTTKPLGQGTGLGLSMIHGFVRQSGGQVRIYSEMGKGTTMCLYLPRHSGDVDNGEDIGLTMVAEGGHGETVLIIDDEATVRMLVAEVLGDAGYTVIEAPDGPLGLEILRSDRRIDLLISDVGLPGGMNGRQVADAARVSRPDLKVLFITGYAENAAVGNGLLAPGMEVLTKPFVMGDLAAKVHDMIEG